jgi:THO complex subunit 1
MPFIHLSFRKPNSAKKHFKQKSLIILRSCNELLRRLSRAEDTVFCGRVFIYLFQSFPLGDKSSVNLRGEFHSENVTTFDDIAKQFTEPPSQDTTMTEGTEDVTPGDAETGQTESPSEPGARVPKVVVSGGHEKKSNSKEDVDLDALYPVFWSLQAYFSAQCSTLNGLRPSKLDWKRRYLRSRTLTRKSKTRALPGLRKMHGSRTSASALRMVLKSLAALTQNT